ncbi:MAG TPA: alpha/beta fold hydrolase [Spirochaetota bacterium]|nr:alpha/beta fold hydrolase [Spirochaetota bacterium]
MEIMKGGEPHSFKTNSEVGILLIHGFTGTTSGMRSLMNHFIDCNYNIECPRLTGHGTKKEDLIAVKYHEWLADVERSFMLLKERAKKIFVIGLSMGGALALHLASKYSEIMGIVVINNALVYNFSMDIQFKLIPLLKIFVKNVKGVASDIKDPDEKEIAYDSIPINGVAQFYRLLNYVKKELKNVTVPTLIFKSKEDHVIPIISAKYTFSKINSLQKEIIWLNNSYHVATMDFDKSIIIKKSADFISSLCLSCEGRREDMP